jgi:glutaconate CoA-transferase subunit A
MADIIYPDVESLMAQVPDGSKIVVFKNEGGVVAMEAARALVRRGVRGLHIVTAPTSGQQTDMLIGAGCVDVVETSGITLSEFGQAPCFSKAVREGSIRVIDSTCPAIFAGLQAGEKGIPFMPLRGLIGSDIVTNREDYKIIDNPFGEDDPIIVLPAITPDYAVYHVQLADRFGNVWVGRQAELKFLSHASKKSLVTCERLYEGNLQEDELYASALVTDLYVGGIAVSERGAWPYGVPGEYSADEDHLAHYARAAKTSEGFSAYVSEFVMNRAVAAE